MHPTEHAIVVNYEVEAIILGDGGEPMIGEQKRCQKNINVKSLTESTNIPALAENIIERCRVSVDSLLLHLPNARPQS